MRQAIQRVLRLLTADKIRLHDARDLILEIGATPDQVKLLLDADTRDAELSQICGTRADRVYLVVDVDGDVFQAFDYPEDADDLKVFVMADDGSGYVQLEEDGDETEVEFPLQEPADSEE